MAKKKENKIYCVYCGSENNFDLEKCSKCKKELHPRNHLFKDYLYEHIRDDLKDKVTDSVFSYIKNYIISHLYGIVMFVSVVFTTVTVITSFTQYKTIKDISEIKAQASNSSGEVTITISTYDDMCAANFDPALINVPFAVGGSISGLKRTIETDILKKGQTIDDWCLENGSVILCIEDLYIYDSGIEKITNEYRKKVLAYADWVNTNGTSDSAKYAKWNMELEDLTHDIFVYDKMKKVNPSEKINKSIELYIPEVGCMYESGE